MLIDVLLVRLLDPEPMSLLPGAHVAVPWKSDEAPAPSNQVVSDEVGGEHAPSGVRVRLERGERRRRLRARVLVPLAREDHDVVLSEVGFAVPERRPMLWASRTAHRRAAGPLGRSGCARLPCAEPSGVLRRRQTAPMRWSRHSRLSAPPVEIAIFGKSPSLRFLPGRRVVAGCRSGVVWRTWPATVGIR